VRRRSVLLAAPAVLLTAAGCGGGGSGTKSDPDFPALTAGAGFGSKPTVAKGEGKPPTKLQVKTLVAGKGPALADGSFAQVNYLGQTWVSDKPFDNSFDRHQPFGLQVGAGQVIKGWDQALAGQKVGSRIEIVIPPALGYGAQGQPPTIPANSTLVFVVDIIKATTAPSPPTAKGTVKPQTDAALPKVGTNTDGKAPTLTVPKGDPPKKLVSQYVVEGTGAVVKDSSTVIVMYKALLWKGGKTFDDSTYKQGKPTSLTLNQISVKGLTAGLAGKKSGSRVLLVIPPDQGFGDHAQTGVPANSTLVFSVDILGVL